MKIEKIILWGLFPFLVSCSESAFELPEFSRVSSAVVFSRSANSDQRSGFGILQPYGFVGNIHSNLYLSYDDLGLVSPSLPTLIDTIQYLGINNSDFTSLSAVPYQFDAFPLLDQVLTSGDFSLKDAIEEAVIDTSLQVSFLHFINDLQDDFTTADNYFTVSERISVYESEILLDTSLSSSDQKVVLTTTAILQQTVERLRKRPKKNTDRDWDLMITTMGATVVGSKRSLQDAIILSLLTEISLSE